MDYFTSTFQDYQPIFVGAGCLALGYMYGRHCRTVVDNNNHVDFHTTSDAAECNNYVADHAMVEPERMVVIQRLASCPSDSALNYLDRGMVKKSERCGKRSLGQLPKKKEDMLWAQSCAFKKQKGVPLITIQRKEPIIHSEQDSDDEILARRLEYFTNRSAFINKPGGSHHVLKLMSKKEKKKRKKKKSTGEVMTNSQKGKDIITMVGMSKTMTRSRSGLCELANLHEEGECSLEDTCKSPKPTTTLLCLEKEDSSRETKDHEETNELIDHTATTVLVPNYAQVLELKYNTLRNPEYLGNDNLGLMDTQCELHEPNNHDSDHPIGENGDARMENCIGIDNALRMDSLEDKQLDLPTSLPPKLHVLQDKYLGEVEPEIKKIHQVPMDKVLKVEIYELLHAADYAKVSFEEIVSLLEEKLKVVLRDDKAHIVSLVREVINISKLLEEEKVLEESKQVEAACNICC